jgi:hypothetical protein
MIVLWKIFVNNSLSAFYWTNDIAFPITEAADGTGSEFEGRCFNVNGVKIVVFNAVTHVPDVYKAVLMGCD